MNMQWCETCRWWTPGHPTGRIGNAGVCTVMLVHSNAMFARNKKMPYWAQRMTQLTLSWDGTGCDPWEPKEIEGSGEQKTKT